ncbi:MAG: protein-glutamate O-methyltransferase [Candidatus Solibacter sp.]
MTARNEALTNRDFDRLRRLIYEESGINLSGEKKTMIETRLKRRLQTLNFAGYGEYCEHLFTTDGRQKELVGLIDAVTTNKTDFFRESGHFDFLTATALPELTARCGVARRSLIWSAGCSTGEEPYTLAMVLAEYTQRAPGYRFSILATDICTEVLSRAAQGIYKSESLAPVPLPLRRKYFMRSRNPESEATRVVPEIRALVEFRRLNFMDADFGLTEVPEIIFCRNVIIYFDRATQVRVLQRLARHLMPGGYFFAGHSESLQGMDLPLQPVAPSVYKKPV